MRMLDSQAGPLTAADVINLVSALVWPVVVLLLVLIFRNPLKNLLGRLKSFETPGFKGAFNAVEALTIELFQR
jgi:hypothetical protein